MIVYDNNTIILAVIGMVGLFSTFTILTTAFTRKQPR